MSPEAVGYIILPVIILGGGFLWEYTKPRCLKDAEKARWQEHQERKRQEREQKQASAAAMSDWSRRNRPQSYHAWKHGNRSSNPSPGFIYVHYDD
jgi:hypothetical protein